MLKAKDRLSGRERIQSVAKSNHLKTYLLAGTAGLFIIFVILALIWSRQPSRTIPDSQAVQGASVQVSTKNLATDLFTTIIAGTLIIKSQNLQAHGNILQQLYLASNVSQLGDPKTEQLAVTIGKLPAEGLNSISDVQIRLRSPGIYLPQPAGVYPAGAKVFVNNTNNYEIAVFWPHGSNYASVVISGTVDRRSDLESLVNTVLTNWQWLK